MLTLYKVVLDEELAGENGQGSVAHAFTKLLRMDIQTWSAPIDAVNNSTLISYCIFMGVVLACVGVASWMYENGNENLFVTVFAYQKPWDKLTSTKRSKKAIKCIDGIRALSMMWVMVGHLYMGGIRVADLDYLKDQMQNGELSILFNGTLSVDIFFVIGAILLAYLSTDALIKKLPMAGFSVKSFLNFLTTYAIYLVNRWMRLTPYIMVVTWSLIAVFNLFATGYSTGVHMATNGQCDHDLWRSFFYLSSWLDPATQLCNAVQWYLSCDFFYFALFPFCAIAYGRSKIIGIIWVSILTLISIGYQIWTSYDSQSYIYQTYRIYSAWPNDRKHDPYFTPWARYHSHGIGILFGWTILNERKNQTIKIWLNRQKSVLKWLIIGSAWACALGLMWITIWLPNSCFRVNWKKDSSYWSINSRELKFQLNKNY